jgi:hypothetical protein
VLSDDIQLLAFCQLILAKLNEAFGSHPRSPVVEMEEYSWTLGPTNDVDTKRDSLVLAQDDPHIQVAFSFGLAGSVKVQFSISFLVSICLCLVSISVPGNCTSQ